MAIGVVTDVTDAASVRQLAERTVAEYGAAHVVCNNAGVAPIGTTIETSVEDWRWILDVNVLGVVHGTKIFGPLLVAQGEGHIVNTASASALVPMAGLGAYCATKHAVLGLSETLYLELAETGVSVSVLCPALVRTGIFSSERNRPPGDGGSTSYGELQQSATRMLTNMGVSPEEVAEQTFDAIKEDRFYVLAHDMLNPLIEERFRRVVAGENPPRENVVKLGDF